MQLLSVIIFFCATAYYAVRLSDTIIIYYAVTACNYLFLHHTILQFQYSYYYSNIINIYSTYYNIIFLFSRTFLLNYVKTYEKYRFSIFAKPFYNRRLRRLPSYKHLCNVLYCIFIFYIFENIPKV